MTSIETVTGKGLGVIARKLFEPGEVILSDPVTIYCQRGDNSNISSPSSCQARQIYQQFNRLSTQDRFKISKLFCLGDRTILNIFSTNSFTITSRYCGLFIKISRINHSCEPNACYNNNGCLEKEVTALRKILEGEEITISYITNNWEVRSIRQEELNCWRFLCSCQVCSFLGEDLGKNDQTRINLKEVDLTISQFIVDIWKSLNMSFMLHPNDELMKLNLEIMIKLPDIVKKAGKRLNLLESLGNQMLLQKFAAHLDCLLLLLKARSLGILCPSEVEAKIDYHGDVVERMADWNIDWRHNLCLVVARSYLFNVRWTYATNNAKAVL